MEGRLEEALLGKVAWMTYGGWAWAGLDRTCEGKGGDIGQRDARTGHGTDVGVDARLEGMAGGYGGRQERRVRGRGMGRGRPLTVRLIYSSGPLTYDRIS